MKIQEFDKRPGLILAIILVAAITTGSGVRALLSHKCKETPVKHPHLWSPTPTGSISIVQGTRG